MVCSTTAKLLLGVGTWRDSFATRTCCFANNPCVAIEMNSARLLLALTGIPVDVAAGATAAAAHEVGLLSPPTSPAARHTTSTMSLLKDAAYH